MSTRDNFAVRVKRTLANRAAHLCSNPACRKLTTGPHSDPEKALTTGHAAHIHAAAPGGPRYDVAQEPSQRKGVANGVWLCRECGDLVDKDEVRYPAELLLRWRADHELFIAEVCSKGYARSIRLLQAQAVAPGVAKRLFDVLEDKRLFWVRFDADCPGRVLESLGQLRASIVALRVEVVGTPLDQVLAAFNKTILVFYDRVERYDLRCLSCDERDPAWCEFRDALAELRKSTGFQLAPLVEIYGLQVSAELRGMLPTQPTPSVS